MAEHPLKIFEKIDPELLKLVRDTNAFALADGALPRRIKFLIAMALDASEGAVEGVKALRASHESGCNKRRDSGDNQSHSVHQWRRKCLYSGPCIS